MKFFVDTAIVSEVKTALDLGLADGVTTNPSLIQKSGKEFKKTIVEICRLIKGPVNAETISIDTAGIINEGREMASWAPNVTIKIPISKAGLEAVHQLESEGIHTTVTLIFSSSQALLAAKAGATYICPFVGRLDDISSPGMDLVGEIVDIFNQFPDLRTEIIVASVRSPNHVINSALLGAHGVTVPIQVIESMMVHPLTDIGIERFLKDWEKVNHKVK
jgi:transaldolase